LDHPATWIVKKKMEWKGWFHSNWAAKNERQLEATVAIFCFLAPYSSLHSFLLFFILLIRLWPVFASVFLHSSPAVFVAICVVRRVVAWGW
jgi:hypothetical protein